VTTVDSELERVEGGFGITPKDHFFQLRNMIPGLRGLAILDNDGRNRTSWEEGGMQVLYWERYEAENYFVTPEVLRNYAIRQYSDATLFGGHRTEIDRVLQDLTREFVFSGSLTDYATYEKLPDDAKRFVWDTKTQRIKLSTFAEEFFRRLAHELGDEMLLTKGSLHRMVDLVPPEQFGAEVRQKLDSLNAVFQVAISDAGQG